MCVKGGNDHAGFIFLSFTSCHLKTSSIHVDHYQCMGNTVGQKEIIFSWELSARGDFYL